MYENTIKDKYSESILVCQHKQGELLAFLYRTENKLMLGMLLKNFFLKQRKVNLQKKTRFSCYIDYR